MNDKESLEKRELILSAIRDSLSNEDEKKYYDNLIKSLQFIKMFAKILCIE